MALDGIVLSNIVSDFKNTLIGGRIDKIYQTERDEIILNVRSQGENYRVLLTAHSSYPRIHFTTQVKDNPQAPPMFCMLLRKHIGSGRIIDIIQPDFERIVEIHIESTSELGDLITKRLIIEIMGRHSNIMLVNYDDKILDSIKHINRMQSSVREVLPGRTYVLPPSHNKVNPLFRTYEQFMNSLMENDVSMPIYKKLYTVYSGMSPLIAKEICYRGNIEPSILSDTLNSIQVKTLYNEMNAIYTDVESQNYTPTLYTDDHKIVAFSSIPLLLYEDAQEKKFESVSSLLESFYFEQSESSRVNQKTADMRRLLQTHKERAVRKKEIQLYALEEAKNKEEHRIWGELLTANSYNIPLNTESFTTINYYNENMSEIIIPLDPQKTPIENAQHYFKLYNKAKRTEIAAHEQLGNIENELLYLESLLVALNSLQNETDIAEFRDELIQSGYIKSKGKAKRNVQKKSSPLHFISSDGFHIYVGKNNTQNDQLTLRMAKSYDLWFHTKDIPGSHVIIVTEHKDVPDDTILQAAQLAAYYSKAKTSSNVPVDYTIRKNVKKPNGAKPGMVIYENNKTVYVTPDENTIREIKSV